jgi:hypothetical protein
MGNYFFSPPLNYFEAFEIKDHANITLSWDVENVELFFSEPLILNISIYQYINISIFRYLDKE